jgi:hypothetical protein
MARLKASSMIEALAALVIISFVLISAFGFVATMGASSRHLMKLKAEKRIESAFFEGGGNKTWVEEEILYQRDSIPMDAVYLITLKAEFKGLRLLERKRILKP